MLGGYIIEDEQVTTLGADDRRIRCVFFVKEETRATTLRVVE
jgi:hypothetical protein